MFSFFFIQGRENQGMPSRSSEFFPTKSSSCDPPQSRIDLKVNNVRATLLAGGDMWWDLDAAQYEVPVGSNKNSLFAGAIWMGGVDETGNLKVAAMTYRQTGIDYWTGPINQSTGGISNSECNKWDKHFTINRTEVEEYLAALNAGENPPVPPSMANYPAHGDVEQGQSYYLAPFYDANNDGDYNPTDGDYPDYAIGDQSSCDAELFGDETVWWVFNDVGNVHTETGAEAIGIEVHAQAFGFSSNDEINDMTFYNYKIINRSSFQLNDTYFGMWVDPDLGNYTDDFVGCDVARGLGYCYNGDENDEGELGYGTTPPAVGVDFFKGPTADDGDEVDNDRDGITDEVGEEIIMSKFVYYNNDFSDIGNPENGSDVYNYLRGIWKDGSPMQYGGNGWGPSGTTNGIACDFMFPGTSDLTNYWGTNGTAVPEWSETTANNSPSDRRFLQSAGPFTMEPGAVNTVTVGVVWARASEGEGALASIERLKAADDKAQVLFDNCFQVLNGPDAPDLEITEMSNALIFKLTNSPSSNNYKNTYQEVDPLIIPPVNENWDSLFRFQGYQVYQLANATVSASELDDPSKARLVFQSDKEDGIDKLVNLEFDDGLGFDVPVLKVDGEDEGIEQAFKLEKDLFATANDKLVNNKPYYYMAVAYGYNNYKTYVPGNDGQKTPYKAGRRNVKVYKATPNDPTVRNNGTEIQSEFGKSPSLTRISGVGSGGTFDELDDESIEQLLTTPYELSQPAYSKNGAPVDIKIIDPTAVPLGDFEFELLPGNSSFDDASWRMMNLTTGDTVFSEQTIDIGEQQLILDWGLSVQIQQVENHSLSIAGTAGVIGDSMIFKDKNNPWLDFVADADGSTPYNWIRSGSETSLSADYNDYFVSTSNEDSDEAFEQVLEGKVGPYKYCSYFDYGPAYDFALAQAFNSLDNLHSFNLVITPDSTKWSICPVLELANDNNISQGDADRLDLRDATTSFNGQTLPKGMGVFPGYAYNPTTGQRLNLMFGENSFLAGENGADMKWNPTENEFSDVGQIFFGGMHSIYILQPNNEIPVYDEGETAYNMLNSGGTFEKRDVFKNVSWVFGYPLRDERFPFLSSEVEIKVRLQSKYDEQNGNPKFTFNTSDLYAKTNSKEQFTENIEKIKAVPNPYYAFNEYEQSKLENRIKITNLPAEATISIYTLNGTLIKTIEKRDAVGEEETAIEWDLTNQSNIQVGSGMYLIHIKLPDGQSKVIKWLGIMREIDLETF
jgi:hypothetical protein